MFKTEKGITLVALVITIIVMLILAGVSISLVLNENNGIIKKSQESVDYYAQKKDEENTMLKAFEDKFGEMIDELKVSYGESTAATP